MNVKEISGPQIPMNTAGVQTPKSYYDMFKQHIPCCNNTTASQPQASRSCFSIGTQYLPTSLLIFTLAVSAINYFSGSYLYTVGSAGGGITLMFLRDRYLGGPPAQIIPTQHIEDLENRQEPNAHLLENVAIEADSVAQKEKEEERELTEDVRAVNANNQGLSQAISVGNENEKVGQDLIGSLQATRNANQEFLDGIDKV